jgi:hypothetical protein
MNQRIPYKDACKDILQHIAHGRYWYVSQDFNNGRSFDPQALQQKKATAVLEELTARIAKFPNPETLTKEHCGDGSFVDVQAQIMLLRMKADSKFMESITRAATVPVPEVEQKVESVTPTDSEFEPEQEPDSNLTGDQKLARAKASTQGLL